MVLSYDTSFVLKVMLCNIIYIPFIAVVYNRRVKDNNNMIEKVDIDINQQHSTLNTVNKFILKLCCSCVLTAVNI